MGLITCLYKSESTDISDDKEVLVMKVSVTFTYIFKHLCLGKVIM